MGESVTLHTYCRDCGDDGPIRTVEIENTEPTETEAEEIRKKKYWLCTGCMYNKF